MKGVIFTFDAFFALMVVVAMLPLVLILPVEQESPSSRLSLQAEDAINLVSKLRIRDVIREPVIMDLYANGFIHQKDADTRLLDFISTLWSSNTAENITIAKNITSGLFSKVFPPNVKWSLSIEGESIFNNSDKFSTVAVSRRVASGFRKGLPSQGFVASAYITDIGGKRASSYFFFGGFVGQGNITAQISLPYDANVSEIYLEMNTGEGFDLYINNNFCTSFQATTNFSVANATLTGAQCIGSTVPNTQNNFTLRFTGGNVTNEYIGGGYIKVVYSTKQLLDTREGMSYYRFPGIRGLINLYDSFHIPGSVNSISANLSFFSGLGYSTLLYIGNTTILNHSGTGQNVSILLNDSYFQQKFMENNISYSQIGDRTFPLRMFMIANLTSGNLSQGTDVVLITDTSGSMAWRLDQDNVNGFAVSNCSSPQIYNSSTSRISLAKCLDKSFIGAILGSNTSVCGLGSGSTGNRVGLVSFSTDANNWESLTNDLAYLESRINAYTTGGGTCISCAINRARSILDTESNANRSKYIVVMTDGVANYRSTPVCYSFNSVSRGIAAGFSAIATRTPPWAGSVGQDTFNAISSFNASVIKAAASGGEIYRWNGTAFVLEQDTGSIDIYGIDVYNSTLAFAAGASARVWRWDGQVWSQDADFGNFNLRGVAFVNRTLAFAVGDSGAIFSWNGVSWSLYQDVGTSDLYSVNAYSNNFAVAGGSSGKIYVWNGSTWSESTDTGNNIHYGVSVWNQTLAFTTSSNGRVYRWNGTSWTNTLLSQYALRGVQIIGPNLAYAVGDGRGDVYEWDGFSWQRTYSAFYYQGNNTTGVSCGDDDSCSLGISESYSALNANYSAYVAFNSLPNLTIDSIGFGPISTCTLGNETIREIARTGNGTAYSSTNASQLQNIYCLIAGNILTRTTQTQQISVQGLISSELFPDSFIQFNYTPSTGAAQYQEVSLDLETDRLPGCNGSFFLPLGMNVTSAFRTSYSGVYWTKNVYLNNSLGYVNVYNLSKYGKNYQDLGDPYRVYVPSALLEYNATNTVRNELGLNATHVSPECSQYDRIIYTARLRASVPFGAVFPRLYGGVIRIYYDLDHNGITDGYTDVSVGADFPAFNSTLRTVDQLDTENALDDAVLRLLGALNFVQGNGLPGSLSNPIDIELSRIELSATSTGSVPFAWGPLDISFGVGV